MCAVRVRCRWSFRGKISSTNYTFLSHNTHTRSEHTLYILIDTHTHTHTVQINCFAPGAYYKCIFMHACARNVAKCCERARAIARVHTRGDNFWCAHSRTHARPCPTHERARVQLHKYPKTYANNNTYSGVPSTTEYYNAYVL